MGVGLTLLGCAIVAAFVGSAISWWGLLALALFSGCYLSLLARAGNRARRYHGGVTVLFGLIHGFGFAGVLLQAELPADRLVAALLGFNLGVEAGQVIIVGAMVVLARVLGDYHLRPLVTEQDETRLEQLKRLIDRMGADINLTAIEEFDYAMQLVSDGTLPPFTKIFRVL